MTKFFLLSSRVLMIWERSVAAVCILWDPTGDAGWLWPQVAWNI
jgi:hypothetical protein